MGRRGSSVERRDSSIRVIFYLDGERIAERLTLNGKSLAPTPANMQYATRLAKEIKEKIDHGVFSFKDYFPDSPRCKDTNEEANLFGNLADLWLQSVGTLADATKDQYGTAVRFWKRMIGEDKPIDKIEHKHLAAKIGGYPWPSAKTHNNYLIALRGIFALEYRGAMAMNSPVNGIENMPTVKKIPDPLSMDERDAILADMKARYDERIYAYFMFMFYTGMRPEEAIALRWSDVDWKAKVIRIQRVRTFKGTEREGSKTNTIRDVDLVDMAIRALNIMKPHTYMQQAERDSDSAADIFQNPVTRRPWHDERSQRDHYWKPSLKRVGIRQRRPYNTRHTYATTALMKGVPPGYLALQLGHSLRMLMDIYQKWMPENDKGGARALLDSAMKSADCSQTVPNVHAVKS
jgi:integrase